MCVTPQNANIYNILYSYIDNIYIIFIYIFMLHIYVIYNIKEANYFADT